MMVFIGLSHSKRQLPAYRPASLEGGILEFDAPSVCIDLREGVRMSVRDIFNLYGIFLDNCSKINVKFRIVVHVILIEFHPFILLLLTLILFQCHGGVKQLKLKVYFLEDLFIRPS